VIELEDNWIRFTTIGTSVFCEESLYKRPRSLLALLLGRSRMPSVHISPAAEILSEAVATPPLASFPVAVKRALWQ